MTRYSEFFTSLKNRKGGFRKTKEQDSRYGGHWFIPIHLVNSLEKGTITEEEFILLSRIENLIRCNGRCVVSNTWLAKRQKCSVRDIQKMLTKLEKSYLVQRTVFDGYRYITTAWTQTKEQI